MRAAVLSEFRKPWQLKDVPEPKPGPGQVVVRIEACGLCGTDVHVHHGLLPFVQLPVIPGHEPVGRVVETGPGVTDLRVGDRVGVSWVQKGCGRCGACLSRRDWLCMQAQSWVQLGGGYADLMLAWANGCTPVPQGLSATDAAPMFCAGYTVMSGLRMARPQPGDRVAVIGIGGLGHIGVQIAKALGHEVVAVTGTEAKKAEARELGADEVVVAGDHAGQALMAAGGADVIVATSNSAKHVSQALAGLRPGGRLVNLGALDGPVQLNSFELMFPPRQVLGGTQAERRDLVDLLSLAAAGKVKPKVELYALDRINEVRDRQESGKVRYRAVMRISD
jgi:2-desacetyl-2-hydroxyethyl bacteriochlorophyllide A dehydrogenase